MTISFNLFVLLVALPVFVLVLFLARGVHRLEEIGILAMIGKIALVLALATVASCGIVQQRLAPVVAKVVEVEPADAYPRYNYGYSIKDALTGDSKSQFETRDGENVQGEYSIVEPDGTLRVVTYTAGAEGFNAVINRRAGFAAPTPVIFENKKIVTPIQNTIPAASIIHQQKLVVPVHHQQKVQFVQQPPQQVVVEQPQPVFVQQPQPPQQIFVQEPQPVFVEQQPIPDQQQPQPVFVDQQPIPVQQQPQPVFVEQQQPQPVPVQQQPIPVQQQPQPIPVQQQPQPAPVQQPQQQFRPRPQPQPQPAPVQQPQQQFQPRPQPQPQPQPFPVQHDQGDPNQADDSPAIVVEASGRSARAQPRRASPNGGSGSSFTYSSSGREYDFNISY